MLSLRVGDVLMRTRKDGRVSTRVVRHINKNPHRSNLDGRWFVSCVKQRKSQYPAPVTLLYPVELLTREYMPTGKRMALRSKLDRKIARHCNASIWKQNRKDFDRDSHCVTQDEVVGVIS